MKKILAAKSEGRAYCFFKSESPEKRIKRALKNMKADPELNIPPKMQFSLNIIGSASWGVSKNEEDQLTVIAEKIQGKGANYMLKSTLDGATHRETADVLGDILNIIYSCTRILGPEEKPVADIYFMQENGTYVSKLDIE